MRILYVFRSLAVWGGIERILVEKMNYLATMYGYEVYMLTTGQSGHPVPYELDGSVHLDDLDIRFHQQYQYRGARRLWEEFRLTRLFERRLSERLSQIRPDVIVSTTADPVNSIARVKGGIPLVVESHNICTRTLGVKGLHQQMVAWLLRRGLKKAACVVALTEQDALEWRRLHIPVEVIPNVVHLGGGQRASLQNKKVIYVGRLDYQKRPMEMVRIWQQVQPHFPDWQLHIYGEGEQRDELEKAIGELNINIYLHRPTSRIFDCYRESSVLALTSLFEPFGLVLPEAMSCGVPVVAYDCPYGPAAIVTDGENGFLVENNNRQTFADRLMQLMGNNFLRHQMGAAAAQAAARYAATDIMPKWHSLFLHKV